MRSLGTTETKYVVFAVSKSTFAKDTTRATATTWPNVSTSSHQATGTEAITTALVRSVATWMPRTRDRATSAPAGRPSTSHAT